MENYTGKRLDGRYEIHEVIGVGGMAVVYKAYDNIDDKIVSVKIMKEEFLANQEFRRRFKNEPKAIAVLSHPNIVKVFDVSYGDKLQYIVMEYVEGITLKEYIEQQGKLEIREAVHFIMQILCALQHAHDKGIVHRDIKPQNIMLLSNGNIKVMDFGIAHFSCSDTKTITDSAIGSVHYISPEQARGEATNDKTDIYSAGVVLYEMLTGRVPFEADSSVSVALMHLQKEPKRPRELNAAIPIGLEQIVMHAMQKNLDDRYQSAAEMLLDIEEFKRNPNVRFRENYYTENHASKTVVVPAQKTVVTPAAQPEVKQAQPEKAAAVTPQTVDISARQNDGYFDDDEPIIVRKKMAIARGIIFALIILFAMFSAFVIWNPGRIVPAPILDFAKKMPIISNFVGTSVEVPNFINCNYEIDICTGDKYSKYRDIIEAEYVTTSTYQDGLVYQQEPAAGTRINPETQKIKLYVAKKTEKKTVPNIQGKFYTEAEQILKNQGFEFEENFELNLDYDVGYVIKTDPEGGTEAAAGSKIVVYLAFDGDAPAIPEIVGLSVYTAKEKLASLGLSLDENYEMQESDKPYGTILSIKDKKEGDKVLPGSAISVVVSKGNATVTVSIKLPDTGSSGRMEAYLNSSLLKEHSKTLMMNGNYHSFTMKGEGSGNSFVVYIDGELYYSCNVNFETCKYSGENYKGEETEPEIEEIEIPSVIGMSEEKARSTLEDAGFSNVTVTHKRTLVKSNYGMVTAQTPSGDADEKFTADTKIVITVGAEWSDSNTDENTETTVEDEGNN